jgi:hypothetical protein
MATLPRRTSVCIGLFKVTSAIVFPSRGDTLQGELVPCAPPLPGQTTPSSAAFLKSVMFV